MCLISMIYHMDALLRFGVLYFLQVILGNELRRKNSIPCDTRTGSHRIDRQG